MRCRCVHLLCCFFRGMCPARCCTCVCRRVRGRLPRGSACCSGRPVRQIPIRLLWAGVFRSSCSRRWRRSTRCGSRGGASGCLYLFRVLRVGASKTRQQPTTRGYRRRFERCARRCWGVQRGGRQRTSQSFRLRFCTRLRGRIWQSRRW